MIEYILVGSCVRKRVFTIISDFGHIETGKYLASAFLDCSKNELSLSPEPYIHSGKTE